MIAVQSSEDLALLQRSLGIGVVVKDEIAPSNWSRIIRIVNTKLETKIEISELELKVMKHANRLCVGNVEMKYAQQFGRDVWAPFKWPRSVHIDSVNISKAKSAGLRLWKGRKKSLQYLANFNSKRLVLVILRVNYK